MEPRINVDYCNSNIANVYIGVHTSDKQQLIDTASGATYVKLVNQGVEWAKNYVRNGKGIPN